MPEGPEVRVTTEYMDQTFGKCKLVQTSEKNMISSYNGGYKYLCQSI